MIYMVENKSKVQVNESNWVKFEINCPLWKAMIENKPKHKASNQSGEI